LLQNTLNLFEIFVQPPGNFLYFLVVIIVILLTWVMAISQLQHVKSVQKPDDTLTTSVIQLLRRNVVALGILTVLWLTVLLVTVAFSLSDQNPLTVLPILERAITITSLGTLLWALLAGDSQRFNQLLSLGFIAIAIGSLIGFAITLTQWGELVAIIDFNVTQLAAFWTLGTAVVSVIGFLMCVVFIQTVFDAPLKSVLFVIMFASSALTLYQMFDGTMIGAYSGIMRLAFAMGILLVPITMYRFVVAYYQQQIHVIDDSLTTVTAEKQAIYEKAQASAKTASAKQTASKPKPRPVMPAPQQMDANSALLLKALGLILETRSSNAIPEQIVKATMDVLRADVGVLLRLQDANYADIVVLLDRVAQHESLGGALNLDDQPTLMNAIERRATRILYPDRNIEELNDFFTRIDIEQIGVVYFQPLTSNDEVVAILVICLPYSDRELSKSEIELLKGIGIISSNLLALSYDAQDAQMLAEERAIEAMIEGVPLSSISDSDLLNARQEIESNLKVSREQVQDLTSQVMGLQGQLDKERTRLTKLLGDTPQDLSISQRITVLTDEQIELREQRDELVRRLQESEMALMSSVEGEADGAVQNLLENLRHEREKLTKERDSLQHLLDDLRAKDRAVVPEMQTMINSMMQERDELTHERNQLRDKLGSIRQQLTELGIEDDVVSLSQHIAHLYDERKEMSHRLETLQLERDRLIAERHSGNTGSSKVTDDGRISAMQVQLSNLASDRESAIKQRDKLRAHNAQMDERLAKVKEHRARLLAQLSGMELQVTELHEDQVKLRAQVQELADENSQLQADSDMLNASTKALQTERDQLLARIDGDTQRLHELGEAGVGSMKVMVDDLSEQRQDLSRKLMDAEQELTQLRDMLKQVTAAPLEIVADDEPSYRPQNPDLLVGLVQELRTPLTSMLGYIDLLLGESAGILGEMQRKFLQRVSANVNRLEHMIDGLVQVSEIDTGLYNLSAMSVDVVNVIEDTITNASIQFREKGLVVALDLDDTLPTVDADKEAVVQIFSQMLTNAYLVSPPDSEITIRAFRDQLILTSQNTEAIDCVHVSVTDNGGGIAEQDIPRVFSRKYKAENPLIQGLGDTGVGLSIAKALAELHDGQLWVEAVENVGSTFHFAIPVSLDSEA